jgi:hypothetical protein
MVTPIQETVPLPGRSGTPIGCGTPCSITGTLCSLRSISGRSVTIGLDDYSYDKKMPIKKAVEARGAIMRAALSDKVKVLQSPGINIYKQVETYKNYRKHLPLHVWQDELYVKPADNILQAVKEEKLKRNAFRIELNKDKNMAAKVAKMEPNGGGGVTRRGEYLICMFLYK